MKYTSYLQTIVTLTVIPVFLNPSFADDDENQKQLSSNQTDNKNVEIEIEPGGFLIESDGDVIEFHTGKSGKKTMSLNLTDILGQNGGHGKLRGLDVFWQSFPIESPFWGASGRFAILETY